MKNFTIILRGDGVEQWYHGAHATVEEAARAALRFSHIGKLYRVDIHVDTDCPCYGDGKCRNSVNS